MSEGATNICDHCGRRIEARDGYVELWKWSGDGEAVSLWRFHAHCWLLVSTHTEHVMNEGVVGA